MAITNGGGSGRRPDRREKDDVYTPVHKTEDFRETVRRIKEKDDGRPIAPSVEEPKQPTFNVPIPGSDPNKGRGGVPTWVYQAQQKKKREQTRKEVIYDLAAKLPKGAKLSDIGGDGFDLQAYIDYQTDIRIESTKNPSDPGDSSRNRHASRVENRAKLDQIAQIRTDVEKE